MLIVGLTGGIATGKSTVSQYLEKTHGLTIVDADLIARQVVLPGTKGYNAIDKEFAEVTDLVNPEDSSLNRPALGKAVFGKPDWLKKLNSIVHPLVRREIVWQIFKAYIKMNQVVILDVPLLFEAGLDKICGLTVTVSSTSSVQIERLLARNPELSPEDAQNRINSQMSNDQRNFRADLVIDNSKDLPSLHQSIDSIVKEIKPCKLWYILDLFPPFAVLSALFTFTLRALRDKFRTPREKSS
jgi:dephospho-CoA kinase